MHFGSPELNGKDQLYLVRWTLAIAQELCRTMRMLSACWSKSLAQLVRPDGSSEDASDLHI